MTAPLYTDLLVAWHEAAGPDHPIWRHNGKMEGRALAESLGLRVPELLSGPGGLGDLEPPKTRPFVLKPNSGYGGKGTYLLVPLLGGAHYECPTNGNYGPWATWTKRAKSDEGGWVDERTPNDRVAGPWLIEAAVDNPDDWNVWVIGGRARLVHRRHRDGRIWQHSCWNPADWSPAGNVWDDPRPMADLDLPLDPKALIVAAELVASHVQGPAVRVDLYEDTQGLIFGEITPFSSAGRNRFSPEWERRLGEAWPLG